MKSCTSIQENISAFLDNELNYNERQQFLKHLKNCDICAGELNALESIIAAMHSLDPVSPPPGFAEQIKEKLRADQKTRKGMFSNLTTRSWFSFGAVAAGLVLMIASWGIYLKGDFPKAMPPLMSPATESATPFNKEYETDTFSEETSGVVEREKEIAFDSETRTPKKDESVTTQSETLSDTGVRDNNAISADNEKMAGRNGFNGKSILRNTEEQMDDKEPVDKSSHSVEGTGIPEITPPQEEDGHQEFKIAGFIDEPSIAQISGKFFGEAAEVMEILEKLNLEAEVSSSDFETIFELKINLVEYGEIKKEFKERESIFSIKDNEIEEQGYTDLILKIKVSN